MTDNSIHSPGSEASFRYLLVSRMRTEMAAGRPITDVVRRLAGEVHHDFTGGRRTVGERTLFRWLTEFNESGMAGLVPKARERSRSSLVLPEKLLAFAREEKEADPRASVPEILRRAFQLGIISSATEFDRTTLYRALRRMGVSTRRRKTSAERDCRRFAWPHRMQMVLADGTYFRAGAKRLKRVALFLIDDSTRMGLEVFVATAESTVFFLTGLTAVLRRFGWMDILYLDRGPGFRSEDTVTVVAKLGISLILGEAAYPEGHGKVEKFNQTAKAQCLRHLDGRPDVDPAPEALRLRLRHWLLRIYNRQPHESLDGAAPEERFQSDERPLRMPESEEEITSRMFVTEQRKVSKDHIASVDGLGYELPAGYAGTRVEIHRHVLDGTVHLLREGRFVQLHPVNLAENAMNRRARKAKELPPAGPTRGAADIAFTHDFGPVVDPDGGFIDNKDQEER